jgi:hypothetical protein
MSLLGSVYQGKNKKKTTFDHLQRKFGMVLLKAVSETTNR